MSNLASRLAASESASSTILAKDRTLSCDTRQTGLNNNALVIGPSGAGKTRSHASAGAGDKYGDGAAGVGGIEQADLLA